MKVSPLDLRQVRFRTTFRGFDKAEVLALIAEVTDDYENASRGRSPAPGSLENGSAAELSIASTNAISATLW